MPEIGGAGDPAADSDQNGDAAAPLASGGGGADAVEQSCPAVGFERQLPTVLVVVDRSGSMDIPFDADRTRWDAVRDTLVEPADGLLSVFAQSAHVGLVLFTSTPSETDPTDFDQCPLLVQTPIAPDNFEAIASTYGDTELLMSPSGNRTGHTPTGESLRAAMKLLADVEEPGPKTLLLVTDGDPDNCMDADANGTLESLKLSLDEVQRAFELGIQTFVVGLGSQVTHAHLQDLAEAGVGDENAVPYEPSDEAMLRSAFSDALLRADSCVFALDTEIGETEASMGDVTLGGQPLMRDDSNGWSLPDPQPLELHGSACKTLKQDASALSVVFPCETSSSRMN